MNHHFEEQRRAAAEAFLESLDQIAICLQTDTQKPLETDRASTSEPDPSASLDIEALEAAIADIEQFLKNQKG